jgi:hypothetical protein
MPASELSLAADEAQETHIGDKGMELRSGTAIYFVLLLGLVPVTVHAQGLPSEGSTTPTSLLIRIQQNPSPQARIERWSPTITFQRQ